jgi:hypothetical protein
MTRRTTIAMLVDKTGADAKQVANDSRIIEIARLGYRANSDDDGRELVAELNELSRLDEPGGLLVGIALKVLLGKRSALATANPETIKRCHSLASDLGATVEDADYPGLVGKRLMVFSPPPSAELRRMFEDIKANAERYFLTDGAVAPRFFLEFESGDFAEVVCSWGSTAEKKQALGAIKQMREHDPLLRYAHVGEVWASSDLDVRPSKSPNRTEHLMIVAEERGASSIAGMSEIRRHALSAKPALGEWCDHSGHMHNSPHFDLLDGDDATEETTVQ